MTTKTMIYYIIHYCTSSDKASTPLMRRNIMTCQTNCSTLCPMKLYQSWV